MDVDLVEDLRNKLGLTSRDAKFILREVASSLRNVMAKKGYVGFDGWGRFYYKVVRTNKIAPKHNGVTVKIPLYYSIKYKASSKLKAVLSSKVKDNLKKASKLGEKG